MNNRLGPIGCSLLLLATLAACGGGGGGGSSDAPPSANSSSAPPPTTNSASRFAYVVGIGGISGYSMDSDSGKLSEIAGRPFGGGTAPNSAVVGPSDKFVYVADSRGVSAYSIDHASGALSEIAGSPFVGSQCCWTAVMLHPSGQFVYALSTGIEVGVGGIWAYRVAATGALVPVEGNPIEGNTPIAIAFDPSGQYAFVIGSDRVYTFRIDTTSGVLTQAGQAIAGSVPSGVAVDPSGTFAFVASAGNLAGDGAGVWSFRIDTATGTLTQIGSVAAENSPNRPNYVAVHPTGKFAYVTNFASDDISAFRIEATGALTSIGAPVRTGDRPGPITVDSTGRYAYVTSEWVSTISGYRIDADTGVLTEIEGSPLTIIDNLQMSFLTITGLL